MRERNNKTMATPATTKPVSRLFLGIIGIHELNMQVLEWSITTTYKLILSFGLSKTEIAEVLQETRSKFPKRWEYLTVLFWQQGWLIPIAVVVYIIWHYLGKF